MNTQKIVKFGNRELQLFFPGSAKGEAANFSKNLPKFGSEDQGKVVATGFPGAFMIYRFSWDASKNVGKWAYLSTQFK